MSLVDNHSLRKTVLTETKNFMFIHKVKQEVCKYLLLHSRGTDVPNSKKIIILKFLICCLPQEGHKNKSQKMLGSFINLSISIHARIHSKVNVEIQEEITSVLIGFGVFF